VASFSIRFDREVAMKTRSVDVAIIGAGTAGLNARRAVEKAGGLPLLIESGVYGTTCARVGCMPSKLLIAAADAAHEVSTADGFGIDVPDWQVDGPRVLTRVQRERDRFAGMVAANTEALPAEQRLLGHARFTGPTTLEVDGHTRVEARAVVIASGSSPFIPPPFDAIEEQLLTSDNLFELKTLPRSLAVVGTGIIGLELGQALQRLGVKVTFFNPFNELGPFTDPVVEEAAHAILTAELDLQLQSTVQAASRVAEGVELRYVDQAGNQHTAVFEKVLVAAGRRPNITDLNLDSTGLQLDERGFPEWDPRTTQVADAPIFLAGDVSGHRPLLHEASDEGEIAGANSMLYPDTAAHVRRTPLAIAFTDPQMAMTGESHAQLDMDTVEIGEASFDNQGRARVMGQNRGAVRIYARRSDCVLIGAEMIAPRAEHMAHLLAWAIQEGMPVKRALEMPFYHPVLEEGLRTALRDLVAKLRVTGECRGEDFASAPGN
jgi:dihydrolipoamide dehydrogenase